MKPTLFFLILFSVLQLSAQDFDTEIYNSYISSEMDIWKGTMEKMEATWKQDKDAEMLYDLFEAQYGYIGYCISMKKKKEAKVFLEKAEKNSDLLLVYDDTNAEVYALLGALRGYRIFLEPLKVPVNGKQSEEFIMRSLELSPEGAQGWLERANMEFYKPVIFGGSKKRSVPFYEKATNLFESNLIPGKPSWMYLNCLAALANAYEETGKLRQADHLYKRILRIEPAFKWIGKDVYPAFKKKHPEI